MAETPENKNNPMFFTDFDVSDKGRPAAFVDEVPDGPLKYRLHTITDLASSLDLDFEDDSDGSSRSSSATAPGKKEEDDSGEPPSGKRERNSTRFIFQGEDQELSLDAAGKRSAAASSPPASAAGVQTWEEFTNAFLGKRNASGRTGQPMAEPAAAASESDEFDILSSLDGAVAGDEAAEFPPPPAESYGGVRRVTDWYAPPEGAPGEVERLDNWFEPPEDDRVHSSPTRRIERDASGNDTRFENAGELFTDLDVNEEWDSKVTALGDTTSRRNESETRSVDLFSDLDLNSLWDEKVRHGEDDSNNSRNAEGGSSPSGADTVILKPIHMEEFQAPDSDEPFDAAATTLYRGDDFHRRQTRRLEKGEREERNRAPRKDVNEIDLLADLESFLDAGEIEAKRNEEPDAGGEEDYLPGLEPESASAGEDDEDFASPEMFRDDFDFDSYSGMRNISPPDVGDNDIQRVKGRRAPVDDSEAGAAQAGKRRPRRTTPDETPDPPRPRKNLRTLNDWEAGEGSSGGGFSIMDDPDDPLIGGDEYDPFALDEDNAEMALPETAGEEEEDGAEEASAESADGEGTSQSGRHSLADGDPLYDMDFDDDSINADISAPVVDNSDIDMPGRRPRPGTEEMQAIMGEKDFSDSGDGLPGEEGDDGDAPPADEVAINPMDVFANMDDMDFSDDFDDDMKAMLDEDEEGGGGAGLNIDVDGFTEPRAPIVEEKPQGFWGLVKYHAFKTLFRVLPMKYIQKIQAMIAWRENWWFYCDLVAAIIASASLAIIISYYLWYRD